MPKSKGEIERIYLELKFLISQLSDEIPQEIRDKVSQDLEDVRRSLYVILPACDDLAIAISKLMFLKCPELKDTGVPYLGKLMSQGSYEIANSIVDSINSFLVGLENNNTPYIENGGQFQNSFVFFATTLDELEDQSPGGMAQLYSNRKINNEKKDFSSQIMEVLFRYFEEQLNNLDEKGWKLIGILIGYQFLVYLKCCCVLMGGMADDFQT